ncbi:hypothetical protein V2G26_020122 [Clonostachys chloroleuca]
MSGSQSGPGCRGTFAGAPSWDMAFFLAMGKTLSKQPIAPLALPAHSRAAVNLTWAPNLPNRSSSSPLPPSPFSNSSLLLWGLCARSSVPITQVWGTMTEFRRSRWASATSAGRPQDGEGPPTHAVAARPQRL